MCLDAADVSISTWLVFLIDDDEDDDNGDGQLKKKLINERYLWINIEQTNWKKEVYRW